MFLELPSFRFQPEFYTGAISRFYPLLYDLAAFRRPAKIVILGFGDSQPHFTFCQAGEDNIASHCQRSGVICPMKTHTTMPRGRKPSPNRMRRIVSEPRF
jgi:hypothetical protein